MNWIQKQVYRASIWAGVTVAPVERNGNQPSASSGYWGVAYVKSYDGEKNLGELGPAVEYYLNFKVLSIRSWQSYLESELSQTIINKYIIWMVDGGLKLQANPAEKALALNGINVDSEKFNEDVEALFSLWSESRSSSFSGMENLNTLAKDVYKHSKIGGDVLVVLRLVDGAVKVQMIDGSHVESPIASGSAESGNKIIDGVEIGKNGQHIAYHVRTSTHGKHERILAVSKSSGLITAFLVYGSKYRSDNMRGLPVIATSLETMKKLERYKEAAVGSAEERAKIAYQIVHGVHSSGESPLASQMASAFDANGSSGAESDLPKDALGDQLANTVAATTNKATFNMPQDSELKALESKNELFFKEFYGTNSDIMCAAVGIPPNVAFSIYNDSFSASRTATKDWEHTMTVGRKEFGFQFYQPIYNFWLHIQILQSHIQAPGYLSAHAANNDLIVDGYRRARYTGTMFPHIDPLKEVKAERAKLGDKAESIPLTTVEQATEALNAGDSVSNMNQFSKELEKSKDLGITTEEPEVSTNGTAAAISED